MISIKMSYYQECIESIEQMLAEAISSSGIQGAFGRFYVEEWLDKPFGELLDPSYDDSRIEIDKMDHCFSVVLSYRYGLDKGYIPEYSVNFFDNLEEIGYFDTLLSKLNDNDRDAFLSDLMKVREHRMKNFE